jgi:putative hydrolase of the HAD superfamily
MTTKKAVILDNEWVMVRNDWDYVASAVADEFGLPRMSGREFKKFLQGEEKRLQAWSSGRITYEEFWGSVLRDYDVPVTPENMERLSSKLEELTTHVDQRMVDLVRELKDSGIEVYMLSNATPEIEAGNRRRDAYHADFDMVYYSHKMGTRKPEASAYRTVLAETGLEADECVFVDDKEANVWAARRVGMSAVKYKSGQPVETLKEKLRKAGVKF